MTLPVTGAISLGRIDTGVVVGSISTASSITPSRIQSMANYLPERTQRIGESISYVPNKKVTIDGQLEVSGDILVAGKSLTAHIEYVNKDLVIENQDLKKRVEELEKIVNMLWYAPGMPGCEESKMDFDSILGTLPLDDNNCKN